MSKISMNHSLKDMYTLKHALQRSIDFKEKALKGKLDIDTRNMYENDIVYELIMLAEFIEIINLQLNGYENCNGVRVLDPMLLESEDEE